MCQHLEMVKRDRDSGGARQVVLQNLKITVQSAPSAMAETSSAPYGCR